MHTTCEGSGDKLRNLKYFQHMATMREDEVFLTRSCKISDRVNKETPRIQIVVNLIRCLQQYRYNSDSGIFCNNEKFTSICGWKILKKTIINKSSKSPLGNNCALYTCNLL